MDEYPTSEISQTWILRGVRPCDVLRRVADHIETNTPPGMIATDVTIEGQILERLGRRGVTVPLWEVSVEYREADA